MTNEPQRSYVFLLRWPGLPQTADHAGWRASLEDARTGERRTFAYPEQLFAYLMQLAEEAASGGAGPPPAAEA
jgi:hypothetical protein